MLANCALGSFVTSNLGGCSVSGQHDLDQSRSAVRKPALLRGFPSTPGAVWGCGAASGGQRPPAAGDGS